MEVLENLKKTLGRRVRQIRKEAGLSAEELAESVSVHPNSIYTLERGENWISPETLAAICQVLGIHPYLLFIEDNLPAPRTIKAMAEEAKAEMSIETRMEEAWKSEKLRPLLARASEMGVETGIRVAMRRRQEGDSSAILGKLIRALAALDNLELEEIASALEPMLAPLEEQAEPKHQRGKPRKAGA